MPSFFMLPTILLTAAGPGCVTMGLLYPGVEPLRTTYEGDFGLCLAEVNYFPYDNEGAVEYAGREEGAGIYITA